MRLLQHYKENSYLSHDGTQIYYDRTQGLPEKPTLIFLHGHSGDSFAWDKIRIAFQKRGYPTVAPDLRGHGFSGRSHTLSSYALDNFAKDLALLIDTTGIKEYVLIGHCLGGVVSYLATVKQHIKPQKLILIATGYGVSPFGSLVTKNKLFQKLLMLVAKLPLRYYVRYRPDYTSSTYVGTEDVYPKRIALDIVRTSIQSYLSVLFFLSSFNGFSLLSKINVPTLIISGDRDTFFPIRIAYDLKKYIPHSKLKVIPGANHILVLNNPEEVIKSIASFLEEPIA